MGSVKSLGSPAGFGGAGLQELRHSTGQLAKEWATLEVFIIIVYGQVLHLTRTTPAPYRRRRIPGRKKGAGHTHDKFLREWREKFRPRRAYGMTAEAPAGGEGRSSLRARAVFSKITRRGPNH